MYEPQLKSNLGRCGYVACHNYLTPAKSQNKVLTFKMFTETNQYEGNSHGMICLFEVIKRVNSGIQKKVAMILW